MSVPMSYKPWDNASGGGLKFMSVPIFYDHIWFRDKTPQPPADAPLLFTINKHNLKPRSYLFIHPYSQLPTLPFSFGRLYRLYMSFTQPGNF